MTVRGRWRAAALGLFSLLALAGWSAPLHAQVVVLRVHPDAEPICATLESRLTRWELLPDPGYYAEALRQGLDPNGDDTLQRLVPPAGARLALIPRAQDASGVTVEFRDGASGASLGEATLPLAADELTAAASRKLEAEVERRVGPPPPAAGEPDSSSPEATPGEPAAADSGGIPRLRTRVFGGVGAGQRALRWPSAGETQTIDVGRFAALELGAGFGVVLSKLVSLGPAIAYQTSLASQIEERHVSGQPDSLRVRAHHFDAVLALGLALGSSGFRIVPALGYGTHNLRPEVHHLLTPSYSLAGPLLRLGVRVPLFAGLALRVAPEVQWLVIGNALEELGMKQSGFGLGGEAALEIPLGRQLALELSARDMHAWLPSRLGAAALDSGQFATLRLVWQP